MINISNELLDKFVEIVAKNKVEIDVNISPDNMEIRIEPWKPYEVKCPYENSKYCSNENM